MVKGDADLVEKMQWKMGKLNIWYSMMITKLAGLLRSQIKSLYLAVRSNSSKSVICVVRVSVSVLAHEWDYLCSQVRKA